ncbi:hypothetical protein D3C72_2091190 [compost metagenome]
MFGVADRPRNSLGRCVLPSIVIAIDLAIKPQGTELFLDLHDVRRASGILGQNSVDTEEKVCEQPIPAGTAFQPPRKIGVLKHTRELLFQRI